jgi:hypothetical protein
VHDYEVSVSHDGSWLVPQRCWNGLDEVEQTFTTAAT